MAPTAPDTGLTLNTLPEVTLLRRVWIQHFAFVDGKLTWRAPAEHAACRSGNQLAP